MNDFIFQYLGIDNSQIDIDLNFVTRHFIKKVNARERQVNSSTDVLSFPYTSASPQHFDMEQASKESYNYENGHVLLGDVLLCISIAKQQARQRKMPLIDNILFLYTHAVLHLLGYDHIQEDDRQVMEKIQYDIINASGLTGEKYE